MAISLRCPTGHALKVPATLAGKRVRCPKCNESVRVPEPPKPARPRPPAEAPVEEPAAIEQPPEAPADEPRRTSPPPPPPGSDVGSRWRTSDSTFAIPSKGSVEEGEAPAHRPPPVPPPRMAGETPAEEPAPPAIETTVEAPSADPAPEIPEETARETAAPPPRPKAESTPPPRPAAPPEKPARKSRRARRRSIRESLAAAVPTKFDLPDSQGSSSSDSASPLLEPPLPKEKPRGVRPTRRRLKIISQLAGGLAVVGVVSMAPGLLGWLGYMRGVGILEPWIWPLMVLGILQLTYALYLVQLPDWTSIWVVTMVSVLCAAIYAMGVGLAVFASRGSDFALLMGLGDPRAAQRALLWCLMLLSLTILVAYFCGRVSHRWRREEILAATKPHLNFREQETVV